MNRGGLAGTAFEMDDAFTGIGAERLAKLRCQGGKMMYRLEPQEAASGRTIVACAQALNDLRREGLAAFLEPLGVARGAGGGYDPAKDAPTLVRQCGIAAGLGDSSSHLWLKLPYGNGFERVCRATTLPILLLGGPARQSPAATLKGFASALEAGANVPFATIRGHPVFPRGAEPFALFRSPTGL